MEQPKVKVSYFEILLRVVALLLGLIALMGALWSGRDGSYPNITALTHALLMFLCVTSPQYRSREMLIALLIAFALAIIDFVLRAVPALRAEGYPPDIVGGYAAELFIVLWFLAKHSFGAPHAPSTNSA